MKFCVNKTLAKISEITVFAYGRHLTFVPYLSTSIVLFLNMINIFFQIFQKPTFPIDITVTMELERACVKTSIT